MAREKQKTILASAARTTAQDVQVAHGGLGGIFIIDITVDPAAASLTFTVEGIDPASLKKYTILASAAKAATGTFTMRVYPSAVAAANVAATDFLPENFNFKVAVADTDSMTYSVGFISFGQG